jgi:hypothetical protein
MQPDKARVTVIGSKPTLMHALFGAKSDLPTLSAEQLRSALTELGVPRLSYSMIAQ